MAGHDKSAPGVLTRSSWHTMEKERSQKKGKKGNSVGGTAPWSIKDEEARRRPKGDAATAAADAQVHTGGGQCAWQRQPMTATAAPSPARSPPRSTRSGG